MDDREVQQMIDVAIEGLRNELLERLGEEISEAIFKYSLKDRD